MPTPTMHQVESSMIESVGYDAAQQQLFVTFKPSGRQGAATWRYDHVTPAEYATLTAAPSIGKAFIANIRGSRTSQRVS